MRLPVIPTIIVAGAVAVMVALGFWQLGRMDEKEALIARAQNALTMAELVEYPQEAEAVEEVLYRRTAVTCASLINSTTVAGISARGQKGLAHRASCYLPDGKPITVDIGFSGNLTRAEWSGGEVVGTIAPGGRVVAEEGLGGLEPLARPDPRNLPNNHLAYAGQWFFFAMTALVIYFLALRRRSTRARGD